MGQLLQRTPQCPPAEEIAMLALGGESSSLAHVSQCDYCSSLLRDATEDLSRDATAEEEVLAKAIAPPKQPIHANRLKWPLAVAAAISVVGLFSFYFLRSQAADEIPSLLAQAYTDSRPFDWRLPDSGYAPVRLQRGTSGGASPALRTAQLELGSQSAPSAKLLGWSRVLDSTDASGAIANLESALQSAPADVETMNLLGVAYARRAELTESAADFQKAVALWDRALAAQPRHAAVQYNRALGLTRLKQYPEAIAAWQSLLQDLPATDSWRSEVQRQMERAKGSYAP